MHKCTQLPLTTDKTSDADKCNLNLTNINRFSYQNYKIQCYLISEHVSEQFMYILFWGGASVGCLLAIYMYGLDFVNKPKLAQSKAKME